MVADSYKSDQGWERSFYIGGVEEHSWGGAGRRNQEDGGDEERNHEKGSERVQPTDLAKIEQDIHEVQIK